jgi:threonine dehydrogenase-like Zn-dependent dehydrogenase
VAIWGCGPVGQFAIRSALMLGAERVIAIDRVRERLQMARESGAEILNYEETEVGEALKEMTCGRGPDSVMDAVGMEAHGMGLEGIYDKVKQAVKLETDRPNVLRQAIVACRKGGTVSLLGVCTGFVDKMPMGAFMNKGLTMKTGQTHVHRYLRPLLDRVQKGDIDPSFVVTHTLPLEQAPHGYEIFKHKKDNCIKIVLKP